MCITGHAVANDFGMDRGTSTVGVLKSLKHENTRSFADDEAVAFGIKGAAGSGGIVITERQGLGASETSHSQWRDASFGTATNHHICFAELKQSKGVADGIRSGCAGCCLFSKASEALPGFVMARSSQALAAYQLGELDVAKKDLRKLILRYPMLADARAAMSALLWRQGSYGEAESHWAAAAGLDNRYRQSDWLLKVRRWPPQPTADLMTFLALESS